MIFVKLSTEPRVSPESGTGWVRGVGGGDRHQSLGTEYNQRGQGRGAQGERAKETDGLINIRRLMPKTYIKDEV